MISDGSTAYRIAGNYFCEFRELQGICENFIHGCLVLVDKERPKAPIHEDIICENNALSRTFAKNFPLYGIHDYRVLL